MNSLIEEKCKELAERIDEETFNFLNANGYKIEKPYTIEKANAIKEQLEKDGKKLVRKIVPTEIKLVDGEYKVTQKVVYELMGGQ